ncbi:MAG: branched-chain amino acid ABC transporter permease [Hyphomicrobiaceae bacterium]
MSLLIDGLLSGAIYALVAMALVITHKTSRAINFALGEWMTLGAVMVAGIVGLLPFGTGLPGLLVAMGLALLALQAMASVLAGSVLVPLAGRRTIAMIMVTLALGMLLRGAMDVLFAGVPRRLSLPLAETTMAVGPFMLSGGKLLAAGIALLGCLGVGWFYRKSRTGVALRAMADDPHAAMAMGIDHRRCLAIAWGLAGALALVTGVLWMALTAGGFSLALLGLKILPILMLAGLDSVEGTLVAAALLGMLESVASGYLDPLFGSGLGGLLPNVALLAMMLIRPTGLFGDSRIARV